VHTVSISLRSNSQSRTRRSYSNGGGRCVDAAALRSGLLVTESVRGDGGVLRNSEGWRYMFDYVPDVFRAQYAETEAEADR
jgi:succinate dehydrogenase/fumarate reductase flavoprotein subunit